MSYNFVDDPDLNENTQENDTEDRDVELNHQAQQNILMRKYRHLSTTLALICVCFLLSVVSGCVLSVASGRATLLPQAVLSKISGSVLFNGFVQVGFLSVPPKGALGIALLCTTVTFVVALGLFAWTSQVVVFTDTYIRKTRRYAREMRVYIVGFLLTILLFLYLVLALG